ncbi:MAG: hypothetical protein ABWZ99_06040 [Ilumatobacteraceae bacterium]
MPDLDLFDKTEIWLTGVTTRGARRPDLAAAAAMSLSIGSNELFVTDVRGDHIVLDLVAAGRLDDVVIVALPGPTREVRAAIPALLEALASGARSDMIAEAIADPIRALWREHHPSHEHRHEHEGGPQP